MATLPLMSFVRVENVSQLTTDWMIRKINIPGIDEEIKLMMLNGFTRFAAAATTWYTEKKKVALN